MTTTMDLGTLTAMVWDTLGNELGMPAEKIIAPGARLVEDLEMESLDRVCITMALEDRFDIAITEEQSAELKTVEDVVLLVTLKVGLKP